MLYCGMAWYGIASVREMARRLSAHVRRVPKRVASDRAISAI